MMAQPLVAAPADTLVLLPHALLQRTESGDSHSSQSSLAFCPPTPNVQALVRACNCLGCAYLVCSIVTFCSSAYTVSMFAAAMLYSAPAVELSIYSTCKRISQKLLRGVVKFFYEICAQDLGKHNFRIRRQNMEEIVLVGPEGERDVRIVNSYPSKVRRPSPACAALSRARRTLSARCAHARARHAARTPRRPRARSAAPRVRLPPGAQCFSCKCLLEVVKVVKVVQVVKVVKVVTSRYKSLQVVTSRTH